VERWLDSLVARRAVRQFELLCAQPQTPRRPTDGLVVSVAAALMYLLLVAVAGLVAWWSLLAFPSFRLIVGVPVLVVLVAIWPRFRALPKDATVLSRDEAPALFALVDDVAAASDAPRPHLVVLDERFAVDYRPVGLLQRRALVLGVPLWLSLTAPEQVAVLAHLFGHLLHGDPRRRALVGPIESALVRLTELLQPYRSHLLDTIRDERIVAARPGTGQPAGLPTQGVIAAIAEAVWRPISRFLAALVTLIRLALVAAAQPVSYRAAYADDALAARVAGTAAMSSVLDLLRRATPMLTRIQSAARSGGDAADWPAIAAEVRANDQALMPLPRRPLPSSLDDHPPVDLRLRMLASFTDSDREPQLAADPRNTDQIARELHKFAKRFQRDLIYG
jgi:heat shock protein HtpX